MPSFTSILLWFFNLRTDLWLPNPSRPRSGLWRWLIGDHAIIGGLVVQLKALFFGELDTSARFVNVSDGGFIENLGVYELLRRKCQVIVAIDNTLDPHDDFHYLRNLLLRARRELGVDISFSQAPESMIRPDASQGLSRRCALWARIGYPNGQEGELFYVKPALSRQTLAAKAGNIRERAADNYRIYFPAFPQETTGDQFFDRQQWQAYHDLGRLLADELNSLPQWQAVVAGIEAKAHD